MESCQRVHERFLKTVGSRHFSQPWAEELPRKLEPAVDKITMAHSANSTCKNMQEVDSAQVEEASSASLTSCCAFELQSKEGAPVGAPVK